MSDGPNKPDRDLDANPVDGLLLQYLAERNVPCPACRYNLRHLTRDTCPECGQRFKLTVGAVTPSFGLLLSLMAPMIMLTGLALLIIAISLIHGPPPTYYYGFYVVMLTGFISGLAVIVLYRKRIVFIRQSRRTKVVLVLLSWVFHIGLVVLCFT